MSQTTPVLEAAEARIVDSMIREALCRAGENKGSRWLSKQLIEQMAIFATQYDRATSDAACTAVTAILRESKQEAA